MHVMFKVRPRSYYKLCVESIRGNWQTILKRQKAHNTVKSGNTEPAFKELPVIRK